MTPELIEIYKEFVGLFKYFPNGTKIFFLRHGQTDNNLNRIAQGARMTETVLNRTGLKQAHEAGRKLEMETMDFAFVSPAVRAKQTFEIARKYFVGDSNRTFELPSLQEIDWGSDIDGIPMSESRYDELNTEWFKNKNTEFSVGDNESIASVFSRCVESIKYSVRTIAEQLETEKFILPDENVRPLQVLFTGHGFYFGLLLTILTERKLQLNCKPETGGCSVLTINTETMQHELQKL